MMAAALQDGHVDAWRAQRGLPLALPRHSPGQRFAFEKAFDELIELDFSPSAAEYTALGKADGFKLPPRPPLSEGDAEPGETLDRSGIVIGGALTLALAMPDLEFVVEPILTKGQRGTLTGHPGSGKTTFFTGLCVAAALDVPFGPLVGSHKTRTSSRKFLRHEKPLNQERLTPWLQDIGASISGRWARQRSSSRPAQPARTST
jgi:hypothetical protein